LFSFNKNKVFGNLIRKECKDNYLIVVVAGSLQLLSFFIKKKMNFRIIFSILLLMISSLQCYSQFTKVFGQPVFDRVLFTSETILIPLRGITLVDTLGNVIWSKQLLNSKTSQLVGSFTTNMDINDKGDFLVKSNIYEDKVNKFALTFFNDSGQIIWSKSFQPDSNTNQLKQVYRPSAFFLENSIFVIGEYEISDLQKRVISIIELDLNGDLVSENTFEFINSNFNGEVSIYRLFDGTFAYVNNDINTSQSQVAIYDINTKNFVFYTIDMFVQAIRYRQSDSSIYIVGENGIIRSPKLLKLNLNFEILISKFLILDAYTPGLYRKRNFF
jgi:hypothetical protein